MLNNPTDTHSYTQKPQYITSVPGCSWSSGCCLFNGLHPEIHHVWVRRTGYPDHIRWCVWGGGGCFVRLWKSRFPPTFVTTLSTFLPHVQKQMCHVQCLHRQIGNISSLHSAGPQLYPFLALAVAPVWVKLDPSCEWAVSIRLCFMNNECSHGEMLKVFSSIGYSRLVLLNKHKYIRNNAEISATKLILQNCIVCRCF